MYLKLTNDHTASFFNNDAMNDESKEVSFKFNPCYHPKEFLVGFEADIKDDLRSCFKRFGVEMDEDVPKLKLYLFSNGNIGPCSSR